MLSCVWIRYSGIRFWTTSSCVKESFTKQLPRINFLVSTELLSLCSAMSGKGCQLLVSPCSVSPSLSMIREHQPQSIRIPVSSPQRANLSPSSGMDKVKRRTVHSFASGKQSGSHGVLPPLSLRRQVLTSGKQLTMPSTSPTLQVPAPHPPTSTVTTTVQTGLSSSNNSFKGKNRAVRYKKI